MMTMWRRGVVDRLLLWCCGTVYQKIEGWWLKACSPSLSLFGYRCNTLRGKNRTASHGTSWGEDRHTFVTH